MTVTASFQAVSGGALDVLANNSAESGSFRGSALALAESAGDDDSDGVDSADATKNGIESKTKTNKAGTRCDFMGNLSKRFQVSNERFAVVGRKVRGRAHSGPVLRDEIVERLGTTVV